MIKGDQENMCLPMKEFYEKLIELKIFYNNPNQKKVFRIKRGGNFKYLKDLQSLKSDNFTHNKKLLDL